MLSLNQEIFISINSLAGEDRLMDMIAIVIGEYLPYLFIIIEVWLYFFAKYKKEALLAFYSMLLGLGINQLIGLIYSHPRPFMDSLGRTLVSHTAENSFPSDHTTFMASIAFALLFMKNSRKLGLFLVIFATIGGLCRVYIGVHYPFDILGSLVVSLISSYTIFTFSPYLEPLNKLVYRVENLIFRKKL